MPRRRAVVLCIVICVVAAWFAYGVAAQNPLARVPVQAPAPVACWATQERNPSHTIKLWEGYTLSLAATRNYNPNEGAGECALTIRDGAGRVVYEMKTIVTIALNRSVTGEDFDGDGKADVVVDYDANGGMHCCPTTTVVSLAPEAHELLSASGTANFEKDPQGRMLVRDLLPGPRQYTSFALQPYAERVTQFRQRKLTDITPEHCARILASEDFRKAAARLTPERVQRFRSARMGRFSDNAPPEWDDQEMANSVLSTALQHVFCGQFDQALKALEMWPAGTKALMKSDFAASIANNYPEFARRVVQPSPAR